VDFPHARPRRHRQRRWTFERPGVAIPARNQSAVGGRYELGGVAREVTLRITAGTPGEPGAAGAATLVIVRTVGNRTPEVPINRIVQGPAFVTIESAAMGLTIEGRYGSETIEGTLQQGPFELPLPLRREKAAS
jgi:hypothetical protein